MLKVKDGDIPLGVSIVFRSDTRILVASTDSEPDPLFLNEQDFRERVIGPLEANILARIRTTDGC